MHTTQQVQVSKHLRKKVFTDIPRSSNDPKMEMRYEIEKQITESIVTDYDVYDMVADMATAFKDYLNGNTDSPAITKFLERQAAIEEIVTKVKERRFSGQ